MSFSLSAVFGFADFIRQRLAQQRVLQVAGSLTFTTLLALVPLFTIALTMMSAFPVFSDYSTRFKVMLLSTLVPEFAGKVITVYMRQFADNAEKLTAAGIVMLGVTSLMLMATIERTFNSIWGVRRARPWLQQSMVYWTVLTLGPLVLGGACWVGACCSSSPMWNGFRRCWTRACRRPAALRSPCWCWRCCSASCPTAMCR